MTNNPTPGQVAYEAWWQRISGECSQPDWSNQLFTTQAAWEAAAQAVLAWTCLTCGAVRGRDRAAGTREERDG